MNKLHTSIIGGLIGVGLMQAILPKTQKWLDSKGHTPVQGLEGVFMGISYAIAYGLNYCANTKIGNCLLSVPTFAFCASTCYAVQAGIIPIAFNTMKSMAIFTGVTYIANQQMNLGFSAAVGAAGTYAINSLIG